MSALLIFGVVLLLVILISERAERTILSTAVVFLAAGFAVGASGLKYLHLDAQSPVVEHLATFALIAILLTDGMRLEWRELRAFLRLPGRVLLLGLPLTLVATGLMAHFVAGLGWRDSWLLGAVLSPTDPVFAAAIVGRQSIKASLRHLLNIESGINDALALPLVLGLMASGGDTGNLLATQGTSLAGGAVLGGGVTWITLRLERMRHLGAAQSHEPFLPLAIGLLVMGFAEMLHANEFIAAFAAGITLATIRPAEKAELHAFTENLAELLKLAALLVFGALIDVRFLGEIPLSGYVFAGLVLVLARPPAVALSLLGTALPWRERLTAMWFGPKGFASVIFGIMVLKSGRPGAETLFHLVALVVILSIIAHSSTDVVIARRLRASRA